MSKKSKKKKEAPFSLKSYLKSGSARKLPIFECWIDENWEENMSFPIVVARKHINGAITFGSYYVDLLCRGIRASFVKFNVSEFEFNEYIDHLGESLDFKIELIPCEYSLVHNIIYAALEFAEECGIRPSEDFMLSKYVIDEDTDNIPLMEDIPIGHNGKPLLSIASNDPLAAALIRQLEQNCGKDNFSVVFVDLEDDDEEEEFYDDFEEEFEFYDWDKDDWKSFLKDEMELDDVGESVNIYHLVFESVIFENIRKTDEIPNQYELLPEEVEITLEPIDKDETEEEKEILSNIFLSLDDPDKSKSELKKIKNKIETNIKKFPKNETFYNYLYICAVKLNEPKEAEKTTKEMRAIFPNYLLGKINEAQILIANEKYEEVLNMFNHSFKFEDVFQNRKQIDFFEIKSYFTTILMFYYFQDQLDYAYPYYKFLVSNGYLEVDEDEFSVIHQLFLTMEFKIMSEAKEYLDSISAAEEEQLNEIADILLESINKLKENH